MIRVHGYYYDGRSSARIPVSITFHRSGDVRIEGGTLSIQTKLDRLSIADRLGDTPRNIFFPDGAKLETEANDAIDEVCRLSGTNRLHALLHQAERHRFQVLLAVVVTVVFIWGGIEFGVPAAAKWTAKTVPQQVERELGERSLDSLERWVFAPSMLDKARRVDLRQRFQRLAAASPAGYSYRLEFRSSRKMGANAVALPGGIIVVTDAMVRLAENDAQLMAVLAHEMGHVEYRHGLRSVLQNSLTVLFMAGLLGDITSVSSLSVTLPTILVESRYSRAFELEADDYAVELLSAHRIDPRHLARALALLEQDHNTAPEFAYLSSHPATEKRIARIESPR